MAAATGKYFSGQYCGINDPSGSTQLGQTLLDGNQANVIACLYTDSTQTAMVWKNETSSFIPPNSVATASVALQGFSGGGTATCTAQTDAQGNVSFVDPSGGLHASHSYIAFLNSGIPEFLVGSADIAVCNADPTGVTIAAADSWSGIFAGYNLIQSENYSAWHPGPGSPPPSYNGIPPQASVGQCGSANGTVTPTAPTTGLCTAGTATAVTKSNTQWSWQCQGTSQSASCLAATP